MVGLLFGMVRVVGLLTTLTPDGRDLAVDGAKLDLVGSWSYN